MDSVETTRSHPADPARLRPPPPGPWQRAAVVATRQEAAHARTLTLRPSTPMTFLPGQHCLVRLTAPNGYRAQRSYSIATPPGADTLDLTVELLPDGEVSTFLHDVVEAGDELEIRGPIGGYFTWGERPALGIGGGSGLVPLMSMFRHARAVGRDDLFRLVVSVRRPEDLYYADEIARAGATVVYTRAAPEGHGRRPGRITIEDLGLVDPETDLYVCGSSGFCDAVTALLTNAGTEPGRLRVERFGFTGGAI